MTKTILAAAALLTFGLGAAQAAEEYVTGYGVGDVSGRAGGAASLILQSNSSATAPQAANSLPSGVQLGTVIGNAGSGTVLGQ